MHGNQTHRGFNIFIWVCVGVGTKMCVGLADGDKSEDILNPTYNHIGTKPQRKDIFFIKLRLVESPTKTKMPA